MNIMELGAIGELVGGVAVIASLIYVAVQVRSSAQEQRESAMREATRELASVAHVIAGSQENADIYLAGLSDFEALGPSGRVRFSPVMVHICRLFEQLYYQNRGGTLEPEIWEGFESQFHDIAGYPGFEGWWPTRAHWFGRRFRSFVESHMGADNDPKLYGERKPAGGNA